MLSSNRRDFFRTVFQGAIGLSIARLATSSMSAAGTLASVPLSEHCFQITGAGANVVVLAQPDGLLLVNGGSAEHAEALTTFLREQFGGRPIRVLFNTDWHAQNTGLNAAVGSAGGKIVAHENTKLWLGAEVPVQWENKTYKPLAKTAWPNDTFYTDGKLTFGQEPVAYGALGQAHTDGDMYVYLPGPNILAAGDVVTVGSYPILDYSTGGWIGGMVTATSTLLKVGNAETRVVPGNGPVQPRAHLQAQFDMLNTMRGRLVKLLKEGLGREEIIAAAPTKDFDQAWGDPDLFLKNAYPGLWDHVRELGGIV